MFNEYAWPVAGMEHVVLDCIGKVRLIAATSDGGPNATENPVPARVSTTRQGVMPMKVRGFGAVGVVARGRTSARFGCQYNGAGQWRRGTLSRSTWPPRRIGTAVKTETNRATGVFIVQLSPHQAEEFKAKSRSVSIFGCYINALLGNHAIYFESAEPSEPTRRAFRPQTCRLGPKTTTSIARGHDMGHRVGRFSIFVCEEPFYSLR